MTIFEIFKQLENIYSPPGREQDISKKISEMITPYVDSIKTDTLGNLIAEKKGSGKKIMLSAHMDEIALVATYIDENGFIRFGTAGYFDPYELLSRKVVFQNGVTGIVSKEGEASFKELKLENLYIDIFVSDKKEAESKISVGDMAVYYSNAEEINGYICSPYLDDRLGCAILIKTIMGLEQNTNHLYFVFSVQEEVGLKGAKTAAYQIEPDIGIAIDVTDTGDTLLPKPKMACRLSDGPAIKIMDKYTICSSEVRELLETCAKKAGVKTQNEVLEFGGTDASAIQLSKGGVLSGAISIPTRYVHTAVETASLKDSENCVKILDKLAIEQINL